MERRLVVLAIFAALCSSAAGSTISSKENSVVTLRYPTSVSNPGRRQWFKGTYTEANPPNNNDALFRQMNGKGGNVTRVTAPSNMPLPDATSFDLVINTTRLADASDYSTATEDSAGNTRYEVPYTLNVYIQPDEPVMSTQPHDLTDLHEGHTLAVTCTVPRLYPAISRFRFLMTWAGSNVCPGSTGCEFTSTSAGSDGAARYTLKFTKTLTKDNNGDSVSCYINPTLGSSIRTEYLKLNVKYAPTAAPQISVTNENPNVYDEVILTCDYTNLESNPPINIISWRIDGTYKPQTSHVNSIIITGATEKDNGNYSCLAGNEVSLVQSKTISLNVYRALMWSEHVAEDATVTLKYNTTVQSPKKRYWYKGYFNSANPPNPAQALFRQDSVPGGVVYRVTAHSYMTTPSRTEFDLRFSRTAHSDTSYYTAVTTDERDRSFYKIGKLQIIWSEEVDGYDNITLKYTTSVKSPSKRFWCRGFFNSTNPPNSANELFRQDSVPGGPVYRVTAPSYMPLPNPSTFDLLIVKATETDTGHYTAVTADQHDRSLYNVGYLVVSDIGCGSNRPAVLTDPAGHIYSPTVSGSGGTYPDNALCQWRVQYTNGMMPHLHTNSFHLESGYDYFKVYDGADTSSRLLGSYTGTDTPPDLTATGSVMFVQFTSDHSNKYSGFDISYSAVDPA